MTTKLAEQFAKKSKLEALFAGASKALAFSSERNERNISETRLGNRETACFAIADPLGRKMNAKEGFAAELFGTHPPMAKRIMALEAMAYQAKTTGLRRQTK